MAVYQSEKIHVAAAPEAVYARLSDPSQLAGQSDKVEATADSVSADLPMMGRLTLRVTERVSPERIQLEAEDTPLPLTLTIHIAPDATNGGSTVQVALEAPLNPFMQAMVEKPVKQALEKMADKVKQLSFNG